MQDDDISKIIDRARLAIEDSRMLIEASRRHKEQSIRIRMDAQKARLFAIAAQQAQRYALTSVYFLKRPEIT